MKKRNYIKPACQNIHIEYDKILAGVRCGETVITGASMRTTSSFKICYHDRKNDGTYSVYTAEVIEICARHNVRFDAKYASDYGYKNVSGWENSNWDNGNCHFIGDIYVDNKRITRNYSEDCN